MIQHLSINFLILYLTIKNEAKKKKKTSKQNKQALTYINNPRKDTLLIVPVICMTQSKMKTKLKLNNLKHWT